MVARQRLETKGISVNADGSVASNVAARLQYQASAWNGDCDAHTLLNRTNRAITPSLGSGSKLHGRIRCGLDALSAVVMKQLTLSCITLSCARQVCHDFVPIVVWRLAWQE